MSSIKSRNSFSGSKKNNYIHIILSHISLLHMYKSLTGSKFKIGSKVRQLGLSKGRPTCFDE